MLVARHGAGSHYVRPDRIYRTGVIQPMVGFVPQRDVMAIARAFTQGPYLFMQGQTQPAGQGVAGLGRAAQIHLMGLAAANMGYFQKLKMRYQAWKARRQMAKMGMSGLYGIQPWGPKAWTGPQVVSLPSNRMAMLVAMQQKDQAPEFAQNNTDVIMQRWNYLRAPTR